MVRIARRAQWLGAIVLLVAFFLPSAQCTNWVGPGGERALPPGMDPAAEPPTPVTVYYYFWEEGDWPVAIVFVAPLLLLAARRLAAVRRRPLFRDVATVILAVVIVVLLYVVVSVQTLFFKSLSYGSYVALAAAGLFALASGAVAWGTIRERAPRARDAPGVART